jgi:hypothetical protein
MRWLCPTMWETATCARRLRVSHLSSKMHMDSALSLHLVAIFKAALQRKITDIDLSWNGAGKETVKTLVAEAKRIIPTLDISKDQPVKVCDRYRLEMRDQNPLPSSDPFHSNTTP